MKQEKADLVANAGLHWTGHALVDVGVAGVCAFAEKLRPEDVTLNDLDAVADFMEQHYYDGKLGSYLTCVFMNSSFVQPKESAESRNEFARRYVRAHRAEPALEVAEQRCVFSGAPATSLLVRTHLPLFSGEGVLNFRPDGQTAIPCAGAFIVAILFLPMASRRSEGRLLAVHADDPTLTLRFARRHLQDNRRLIGLALPTERALFHPGYDHEQPKWDAPNKRYKYADAKGPRSLIVYELTEIAGAAAPTELQPRAATLTAYLLSNSGQGPSLEIFRIPAGVASFVLKANGPATRSAWQVICRRFWPLKEDDGGEQSLKGKRKKTEQPLAGRAGWTKNPAFEELCSIYDPGFTDRRAAARWLRRYVLGRIEHEAEQNNRFQPSSYEPTEARSWKLADLFLTEVLNMKPARIQAIRNFADKLAKHIYTKHERGLYRALLFERRISEVRQALLRAQRETVGGPLLFGLDEFATVWLHEDGDEYLVRDLVCIRIVEELSRQGFEKPEEIAAIEGENANNAATEGQNP